MRKTQRLRLSLSVVARRQHTSGGRTHRGTRSSATSAAEFAGCDACGKARAYRKDCRATCLSIDRRELMRRSACTTMSDSVPTGTRPRKPSALAVHLHEPIWVPRHTRE
jgi:hypothetical protein